MKDKNFILYFVLSLIYCIFGPNSYYMTKRVYSTLVAFTVLVVSGYANKYVRCVDGVSTSESMAIKVDTAKIDAKTHGNSVEGIEFIDDVITYRNKTEKVPTGLKISKGKVAILNDCEKNVYRFFMPDIAESITVGSSWVEYAEPSQDIVPVQYIKTADFAERTCKVSVSYYPTDDIEVGKVYIFKSVIKNVDDIAIMPIRITDSNATLYSANDDKDSAVDKMEGKIVYAIGNYTSQQKVDFSDYMYDGEEILSDYKENGVLYINPEGKCFVRSADGSNKPTSSLYQAYDIPNYSFLGWIYPRKIVLDQTLYVLSFTLSHYAVNANKTWRIW